MRPASVARSDEPHLLLNQYDAARLLVGAVASDTSSRAGLRGRSSTTPVPRDNQRPARGTCRAGGTVEDGMSLPESSSMTPRILLVVESAGDARAIVGALRRAGWLPRYRRVAAPRSLTGALKNGVWDAVVIDCQLRRLDVVETIAAVLARDGDLPVVAVSGAPGALAVETLRAGAVDYLLKTDLRRLPATLVRELRRAGERRELRATRARLSDSEERFRTLVEAANQIVWTAGPDSEPDGRIDDWTAFTGQSPRSSPARAGSTRSTPRTASAPTRTGVARRAAASPTRVSTGYSNAASGTAGCRREPCRGATRRGRSRSGSAPTATSPTSSGWRATWPSRRTTTPGSWRSRRPSSAPWATTAGSCS